MSTPKGATTPEKIALDHVVATSTVRARVDDGHVARLAEVLERCPPILLAADGTLIDGAHRLEAARLRGWTTIPAIRIAASARADVLLAAARANAEHGLPLGRDERRSAVRELLALDPALSDRTLAGACGVARSTVARLREEHIRCSGGAERHLRQGQDSRCYPATPHQSIAALADAIVRLDREITVRALAAKLGVSVGTAHHHRAEVLSRLHRERRWIRAIRRAIARWRLWRHSKTARAAGGQ